MSETGVLVSQAVSPTLPPVPTGPDLLRPSEYTGLLMHAVSVRAERIRGARVMEVGVGSGVVLAAMAELGASHLTGVDLEWLAVQRATRLLTEMPGAPPHCVVQGNMWAPFAGQRFDVIVANLPHFPAEHVSQPTRLDSWSNGGADGRWLLNQFLDGLPTHLAPNGLALIVHSAFTDLDLSRTRLTKHGFAMETLVTTLIQVEFGKLKAMSPAVRTRFAGTDIKQFGSYVFAVTHVVEITRDTDREAFATP